MDLTVKSSSYEPIPLPLSTSGTATLAQGRTSCHLDCRVSSPEGDPASALAPLQRTLPRAAAAMPSHLLMTLLPSQPAAGRASPRTDARDPSQARKLLRNLAPATFRFHFLPLFLFLAHSTRPAWPLCCPSHVKAAPASGPWPLLISLPRKAIPLVCTVRYSSHAPHVAI